MDRLKLPAVDYEADFVLWLERQIGLLRERQFAQLDVESLLDELEGTVRREHRELRHRLIILMMHLLKCQYQPQRKSGGWRGTLSTQRFAIKHLINDSPSLARRVAEYADSGYPEAVRRASDQTELPQSVFPESNPYPADQLLDLGFEP